MWLMLQQKKARDYIIATGKMYIETVTNETRNILILMLIGQVKMKMKNLN